MSIKELSDIRIKSRKNNPVGFAKNRGIELRHLECSLENFDGPKDFIKKWEQDKTYNIFITGQNAGTGKTHLAVGLMKYIGASHPVDAIHPNNPKLLAPDVIFTTFTELMMEIRATYSEALITDQEIIKKYSEIPYLFIDDIGAEKTSEHTVSVLYSILNKRYNKMLPTISTTNMGSKDIAKTYHQRIFSRLSSGIVVVLEGKDRRLNMSNVFQSKG